MDFSPELTRFQGAIISANNVYPFSRIECKEGNEENIVRIVESLFSFLQENRYVTQEGITEKGKSHMRKFCFYLLLNADFSVLEYMVQMPGLDTMIWTVPTISKCLICEIVWNLKMEPYIYETVMFCNPLLAQQILFTFTNSIKFDYPIECLKKLESFCTASYRLLYRLNFFNYDSNTKSKLLSDIYDEFSKLMTHFHCGPKSDEIDRFAGDNLYKYRGQQIYAVLNTTLKCLNQFTSLEEFQPEGFEDVYLSTINPEGTVNTSIVFQVSECLDKSILQYLHRCNICILDLATTLLMDVSVEYFCAWSEFVEDGESLQKSIGEVSYVLHSKIKDIASISNHPLCNMLLELACKPVDIHDIIKSANDHTIIENASKGTENKMLWLQAIIERENLLQNIPLLGCLLENIEFLKLEDRNRLIDDMLTFIKNNEPSDYIKTLFIKILSRYDDTKGEETLSRHFVNKHFNNILETSNFDAYITEIFNKFISTSGINLPELYSCFIQNPSKVYTKIVNSAISNLKQCEMMINMMQILSKYSDYYYQSDTEPCIVRAVESICTDQLLTDPEKTSYIQFMTGIKRNNVLPGPKLLILIIMPKLYKTLIDKDLIMMQIQLKLLKECYSIDELLEYRAPVLAMLAQILESVRWNIITFDWEAPPTLEEALSLQKSIFATYQGVIPDKDSNWLKRRLSNLQPMNMYYYKELWGPPGDNFLEVISGERDIQGYELSILVSRVIVSSTPEEWSYVWESLKHRGDVVAMDTLFSSVIMDAAAERDHRAERSWNCVQYLYRNFMLIIKNEYLKEPLSDSRVEDAMDKIIEIANLHNADDMVIIEPILLSLFSYIAEKKQDYNVDVSNINYRLHNAKFATLINQIFSNGNV